VALGQAATGRIGLGWQATSGSRPRRASGNFGKTGRPTRRTGAQGPAGPRDQRALLENPVFLVRPRIVTGTEAVTCNENEALVSLVCSSGAPDCTARCRAKARVPTDSNPDQSED
jgi:hypothetical protein